VGGISEWQCKGTAFFGSHQISGGDKARFSAAADTGFG